MALFMTMTPMNRASILEPTARTIRNNVPMSALKRVRTLARMMSVRDRLVWSWASLVLPFWMCLPTSALGRPLMRLGVMGSYDIRIVFALVESLGAMLIL